MFKVIPGEWGMVGKTLFLLTLRCPICGYKIEGKNWLDTAVLYLKDNENINERIARELLNATKFLPTCWPDEGICPNCWESIKRAVESDDAIEMLQIVKPAVESLAPPRRQEDSDGKA
jgi:RNA polymerase subunit RPABC4/transcription elongation factor Spt4